MPISTSTVELGTLNFRMADPAAGPRSPVQVAPRPRCQGQCGPAVKSWSLCLATVVALLAVLVWVLPSLLLQGIGMLMLYAVMPRVMKHVYPTRLGMVHVYAFRLVHRVAFNSQPHSRSIKVDLVADGTAWPFEDDPFSNESHDEAAVSPSGPQHTPPCSPPSVGDGAGSDHEGRGESLATAAAAVLVSDGGGGGSGGGSGSGSGGSSDGGGGGAAAAAGGGIVVRRPASGWPTDSSAPGRLRLAEEEAQREGACEWTVHTVACLLDNYCYVLVDRSGGADAADRPRDPS